MSKTEDIIAKDIKAEGKKTETYRRYQIPIRTQKGTQPFKTPG